MTRRLRFEGRRVAIEEGDSVASALYRAGVRTFTRSLKYHRRRGLSCVSGDCPNCLINVDGEPGVRACVTEARDGQVVHRESGRPSTEHDWLHVTDHLHRLMPVGFYHKTFIRPRFAWEMAERVIRRATGVGRLPEAGPVTDKPVRAVRVDVLVVGGGVAGLAAAIAAAANGARTLVVDEGSLGSRAWDTATRERIGVLAAEARSAGAEIRERHTAVGVYEGPFVPVVGPEEVLHVEAGRVIAATGAVEAHAVFPGNDLPGVFLSRGAARLAAVHGVAPGRRAVVATTTEDGDAAVETLRAAGVEIAAVVGEGAVVAAEGKMRVHAVVLATADGSERIACDTLVLSLGWSPRDELIRMGTPEEVTGAGEVIARGCSVEVAEASEGKVRLRVPARVPGGGGLHRPARRERLRVLVRRRLDEGSGAGVGRGLALLRDLEALHDRDDGTVPGRGVRSPARGVRGRPGGRADIARDTHHRAPPRAPGLPRGPRRRRRRGGGAPHVAARPARRDGSTSGTIGLVDAADHVRGRR